MGSFYDILTDTGTAPRADRARCPGPFLLEVRAGMRRGRGRWWQADGYTDQIDRAGLYDEEGLVAQIGPADDEHGHSYPVDARALLDVAYRITATLEAVLAVPAPRDSYPVPASPRAQQWFNPPTVEHDPVRIAKLRADPRVQWVTKHYRPALSLAGACLVIVVCEAYRCGPYDLRGWDTRLRAGLRSARFSVTRRDLATHDSDGLTRLVLVAHQLGCRVSIDAQAPGLLQFHVHLREARPGEPLPSAFASTDTIGAGLARSHPTIHQALARFRRRGNL